jgi:hypothetical protein
MDRASDTKAGTECYKGIERHAGRHKAAAPNKCQLCVCVKCNTWHAIGQCAGHNFAGHRPLFGAPEYQSQQCLFQQHCT